MRKSTLMIAGALALGCALPAFACSSHGTIAGNNVNAWVNGNGDGHGGGGNGAAGSGVNATGFSVTGGQWDDSNPDNNAGWGHDQYYVTVTFPGTPSHSVTIWADPEALGITDGESLETWLENEAIRIIREAAPPDQALSDFVG